MSDLYRSFEELRSREPPDAYRIVSIDRSSAVTIIAPHGGKIEPGTSEIARELAAESCNLYLFEGLRRRSGELHITSHLFDEPRCLELIGKSDVVIAIHGRANKDDQETIYLGGLDQKRINDIAANLTIADFRSQTEGHEFPAKMSNNICNREVRGKGVQLELPLHLRKELAQMPAKMNLFIQAIRGAI